MRPGLPRERGLRRQLRREPLRRLLESPLWGWSARPDRKETSCQPLCAHLVLAVHRRDVERLRVLAAVRMLGAVVEMKRAHLVAAERPARNHAFDRFLKHALGEAALEHLARGDLFNAAGETGVLVIDFVIELAAGEADLAGVDDDHMVAAVDMRGEARLVLAAEDIGDDRRKAADDQPFGVDQMPFLL